jgi:L-ascorbate metabolism protein UlaG (beta-lactamase superfamily)
MRWRRWLVILAALFLGGGSVAHWSTRYYTGPASDHFDGSTFFIPGHPRPTGFSDFLRWQRTREQAVWPASLANPAADVPPARVDGAALRVSFVGHATVLLQTQGLNILTDPVWSERTSPFQFAGPKRVRAPGIVFAQLPKIDVVLVSHNHYDHLDVATLRQLIARDNPLIITPLGNDAIIGGGGRFAVLDWDQSVTVSPALRVEAEPVQHWSSRWGWDNNRALWAGFTLHTPSGRIVFAGDTGLGDGWWVDRIAKKPGAPVRFAMLPIGAYEPRWFMRWSHMNPDDAVQAFERLGRPPTLGIHFGTWQLTDEAVDAPEAALAAALAARGINATQFRAVQPGQVWDVPETIPSNRPTAP